MVKKYFYKFKGTGINSVIIKHVIDDWDGNWFISQWDNEYILCKGNKGQLEFKSTIDKDQAKQLIDELNLVNKQSDIFKSASTWRK